MIFGTGALILLNVIWICLFIIVDILRAINSTVIVI